MNDLKAMLSEGGNQPVVAMLQHSPKWLVAYDRRWKRVELVFSTIRDPNMDRRVLDRMYGCQRCHALVRSDHLDENSVWKAGCIIGRFSLLNPGLGAKDIDAACGGSVAV